MSLYQMFLDLYNSEELNTFVKLCISVLGTRERPTRKDDRARFLVATLQDRDSLRKIWTAMDELARKAVASAYHNEGTFVADAFVAQYGELPARPPTSSWYYAAEPILMDLFIHEGQMPPELLPLLKDLVPPLERFQIQGTERPEAYIDASRTPIELRLAATEQAGWHDLLLLLQLVDQRALKFSGGGEKLTPGGVSVLLDQLLHGDFFTPYELGLDWDHEDGGARSGKTEGKLKVDDTIRPFGLTIFARGAGLITTGNPARLTDLGRAFLSSQDPELLLEAFEKWTRQGTFDEITRIRTIKGFKSRGLRLTNPAMRRERIVEALSWCPTDVWISITDFYRGLKVWRFDFDVEEGGIEKLYVGYSYAGSGYYEPWASEATMWLLINGLYINAVLWEYLATIGALDIAYLSPDEVDIGASLFSDFYEPAFSRYDGLFYFRINPLGAYLFGQAGDYQAAKTESAPLLHVNADRLVTVLDPKRLTPVIKTQLEQFAVAEGNSSYRLDAQKLLLALEHDAGVETLRDFLSRSGGALPEAVDRWLDEVQGASRAFTVDIPMVRIRAASEELVQLVMADPDLAKFCQPLGNRALLIPANRQARLRTRLRELGYGLREK